MSIKIPTAQQAIVFQNDRSFALNNAEPVLKPDPGQILVKISVAAQNPLDWQAEHFGTLQPGDGIGCDFAGRVAALGEGVTNLAVGDRVAGFSLAGFKLPNQLSAFREYTITANPMIKIPDNISDEEAATIPLASTTAALGMLRLTYFPQIVPLGHSILVWGGASSVGLFTIQLAHLIGLRVITTASPKNHALVKENGADVAVDYRAPDVVDQVVAAAGRGGVDYVYDAISESDSIRLSSKCLRKDGPRKAVYVSPPKPEDMDQTVEQRLIILGTCLGHSFTAFGTFFPRDVHDLQFGSEFFSLVESWLRDGVFKGNPFTVIPGGLSGVPGGLQFMKDGKVSGTKLVYRIGETPKA